MKNKTIGSLAILVVTGALCVTTSPLRASETDDRIEETAAKSYVFQTYLKEDSVKTKSDGGVVTLSGTVAYDFHKALAQDTVEGLPGVNKVNNQIVVKEEIPSKDGDVRLARKVKSTLILHRSVDANGTQVTAKDGSIHLTGKASSIAQKELTTEYANDVEGVKNVDNDMTVAEAPDTTERTIIEKIDDSSITAQIKLSLLTHRSTSALKTEIKTVNGVVTVGGLAQNTAERTLVTKLVSDIHGVSSVVNNMKVKNE